MVNVVLVVVVVVAGTMLKCLLGIVSPWGVKPRVLSFKMLHFKYM